MRKIDGKFHVEADEIVKTSNGERLPSDEPVFLLRARDHLALPLLKHYLQLSLEDDCTDYQINGVEAAIVQFEAFQTKHPERMKQPGITRGL